MKKFFTLIIALILFAPIFSQTSNNTSSKSRKKADYKSCFNLDSLSYFHKRTNGFSNKVNFYKHYLLVLSLKSLDRTSSLKNYNKEILFQVLDQTFKSYAESYQCVEIKPARKLIHQLDIAFKNRKSTGKKFKELLLENYGFAGASEYDISAESFGSKLIKVNADFETGEGVTMFFKVDESSAQALQLPIEPSNINAYTKKLEKIAGENFYIQYQKGISEPEKNKNEVFIFTLPLIGEDESEETPTYEIRYSARLSNKGSFEIIDNFQWRKTTEETWKNL